MMNSPHTEKPSSLIEFREVSRVYGTGAAAMAALRGVSLSIGKGEFVAVMGPSGSGKSTSMNILGCLDTPSSGSYLFNGIRVETLSRDQRAILRRHYLGFVFQGFNLLKRTSARENVELPLVYRGVPAGKRKQQALEVLEAVGLKGWESHTPGELSGGQQQRVAIARAIVTDPEVLLADEPTGNLDSARSRALSRGVQKNSSRMGCRRKQMSKVFHITSGDIAGGNLAKAGLPGEVFVWHDILYAGPRQPVWPGENTLGARARFLEAFTAGGLDREGILKTLHHQYQRLAEAASYERVVLWFDACLFDQSMLAHILTCLSHKGILKIELLCIDAFPGIEPFHGLGQLQPEQLGSLYSSRCPVSDGQFKFAAVVDKAFAIQDVPLLIELSEMTDPPLPWVPAAAARWLQEQPDPATGLGRLESLALAAIHAGCETPGKIFTSVAAADTPPQFWGDTTLWAKINGLAHCVPPLVRIEGPMDRLPQWESSVSLNEFRIKALPNGF